MSATPSASTSMSSSMHTPRRATAVGEEERKKRKRVSRACDQCFLKKDRCDGLHPICTFCSQLQRSCTYDRPERKRGPTQGLRPRLEHRILALETVLGFVLSQVQQPAGRNNQLNVAEWTSATEEQRASWRKQGWLKSKLRRQLGSGLQEDLVPTTATLTSNILESEAKASTPAQASASSSTLTPPNDHDDGDGGGYTDSDESEVDLALPPTHQPPPEDHHPHRTSSPRSPSDAEGDGAFTLPLLSSGNGGSSLNRGLVPRGADPNAALGGFEIEFGGNQTDEDWVRSFRHPHHRNHPPQHRQK